MQVNEPIWDLGTFNTFLMDGDLTNACDAIKERISTNDDWIKALFEKYAETLKAKSCCWKNGPDKIEKMARFMRRRCGKNRRVAGVHEKMRDVCKFIGSNYFNNDGGKNWETFSVQNIIKIWNILECFRCSRVFLFKKRSKKWKLADDRDYFDNLLGWPTDVLCV